MTVELPDADFSGNNLGQEETFRKRYLFLFRSMKAALLRLFGDSTAEALLYHLQLLEPTLQSNFDPYVFCSGLYKVFGDFAEIVWNKLMSDVCAMWGIQRKASSFGDPSTTLNTIREE